MTLDQAIERVLEVASSQEGVREVGGNNRGPQVEAYLRRVSWHAGAPWCAAFVGWCGSEALGDRWPLPLVPGTWTLLQYATRYGWVRRDRLAERGDVFLTYSRARKSWHTGFVLGPSGTSGAWCTIEGNTSQAGSHLGDGVYALVRTFSPGDLLLRWSLGFTPFEEG